MKFLDESRKHCSWKVESWNTHRLKSECRMISWEIDRAKDNGLWNGGVGVGSEIQRENVKLRPIYCLYSPDEIWYRVKFCVQTGTIKTASVEWIPTVSFYVPNNTWYRVKFRSIVRISSRYATEIDLPVKDWFQWFPISYSWNPSLVDLWTVGTQVVGA